MRYAAVLLDMDGVLYHGESPLPGATDFVVVGEGAGLDYESLTRGLNLILKQGARLIATNPDTDIAGAARLGLGAALVRSGRFSAGEPWPVGLPTPDWDELSLQALAQSLEMTGCG